MDALDLSFKCSFCPWPSLHLMYWFCLFSFQVGSKGRECLPRLSSSGLGVEKSVTEARLMPSVPLCCCIHDPLSWPQHCGWVVRKPHTVSLSFFADLCEANTTLQAATELSSKHQQHVGFCILLPISCMIWKAKTVHVPHKGRGGRDGDRWLLVLPCA